MDVTFIDFFCGKCTFFVENSLFLMKICKSLVFCGKSLFFVENYLVSCGKLSSFLWKTWEWEERPIFSSGWGKDRDRRPLQDPICHFFNFSYLLGGDNFLIHIKNGQNFKPPTKNKSSQTIRIRKKNGKADFVELVELYFPFKIDQIVEISPP